MNHAYIPVLCVPQHDNPGGGQLLQLVIHQLRVAAISTRVIKCQRGSQKRSGFVDEVFDLALQSDLLIIDGFFKQAGGTLEFAAIDPKQSRTSCSQLRFECHSEDKVQACAERIVAWLMSCLHKVPVWGCILIGGESSRMGSPKHLLAADDGKTWLQRSISVIEPEVDSVVISGAGDIPQTLTSYKRIADIPGVAGPLSGIASAMRYSPTVSWLLLACDMPGISTEAINWLLKQRKPGRIAIIPKNPESGMSEPLFAWYDFRCSSHIQKLLSSGKRSITQVRRMAGVYEPKIPANLYYAWRNINRPEERRE
ncbi:MAG: molybdenum cofactor guanylyltransferase [Deltaproteobacteria bacterium]|nr:molybdenum cofactor guanylyltransferase [Deltaproteobacteria bacterium]